MKKLIIVLLLLTSITSYSQKAGKVDERHFISYVNGEWKKISTTYPSNVYIIFNGSEVVIDGEDKKFITYGAPTKNDNMYNELYTWKAYDGDQRKCVIMMLKYKDSDKYMVTAAYIYDSYGYEYIINE